MQTPSLQRMVVQLLGWLGFAQTPVDWGQPLAQPLRGTAMPMVAAGAAAGPRLGVRTLRDRARMQGEPPAGAAGECASTWLRLCPTAPEETHMPDVVLELLF